MGEAARVLEVLDPTLLDRPITGAPVMPSEEEGPDPRMEAVTTLVAKGSYLDAAKAAESLLRENQRDMRLLGPYLFGGFVAQGMHALPAIFRSITRTLTENWDAFGPEAKKALFADNAVKWLLKMMSKHMEHHARLKDAQWQAWCEPGNHAPLQEALLLAEPVLAALASLPKSGSPEPFRSFLNALRAHAQALPPEVSAEPPAEEKAPDPEPEEEARGARDATPGKQGRPSSAPPDAGPMIPVSPPLAQLIRKLSAFEALVASEDFVKASVVAVDVLGTIERFDPRVYLPMLFSGFFTGLSQHAETIEPLLHGTESLSFRALDQLYRVDLDAFLAASQRQGGRPGDED